MWCADDLHWMQKAREQALLAGEAGEVPVGAVLVKDNQLVATGANAPISAQDPTAHAEIVAIRKASAQLQNYRLVDTTLYVTLEPCMMCVGAIIHARIKRLVFGAYDPKTGVVVSQAKLLDTPFLNHRVEYAGGLLAKENGEILQAFFAKRREAKTR